MTAVLRRTRRTTSIVLVFVNNFLNGLEYSIILPSLWAYLRTQGTTTELFFGVVVSSFNFAATLSGILAGCCADEAGRAKKITVLFSLFQVTGNLLYFVGGSPSVLLLSRLVAGFGAGSMTALYSEINRSTSPKERTPLLTGIFLMYHFSILLGPAINKALYSIGDESGGASVVLLGTFRVHGENAGGLVLGAAWAAYFVVFSLLFANDLPALLPPVDQTSAGDVAPVGVAPSAAHKFVKAERNRHFSASREHSERSSLALQRHVPYGAATNLISDLHKPVATGYSRLSVSAPQLNVEGSDGDDADGGNHVFSSATPSSWGSSIEHSDGSAADVDANVNGVGADGGGGGGVHPARSPRPTHGGLLLGGDGAAVMADEVAMLMVRSCDAVADSSKSRPQFRTSSFMLGSNSLQRHYLAVDDDQKHSSSLHVPRVQQGVASASTSTGKPKQGNSGANRDYQRRHHHHGCDSPACHHSSSRRKSSPGKRHKAKQGGARGRTNKAGDKGCAGALTDDVLVALLFLQTVTMFVDTMIETTIPPTLERIFGYGPMENSMVFMAVSLGTLFVFVLLTLMSSWVPDLIIAVFGSLFMFLLLAGLLVLSTYYGAAEPSLLFFSVYVTLVVLCFTSSAAVAISTMTLMTKAIPLERQGTALKLRRAATFVGVVLGPLWAGGLMLRPVYMLAVGVVLILLAFCLTTTSSGSIIARLRSPSSQTNRW